MSSDPVATLPLLAGAALDAPIAWRGGRPLSRRQYLADVQQLASRLPEQGAPLAMTSDRYRFALSLGAAPLRGQASLLPPNHTPDMVARLKQMFPGAYALTEANAPQIDLPSRSFDLETAPLDRDDRVPQLGIDTVIAHVLTSGTTGTPTRHAKTWGVMALNIRAEAQRLARHLGRASLDGVVIVGTVPPHHMYGLESTVLLAMIGGAAFAAERPFFAGDIAHTLSQLPRPRMLVITPFHLKSLIDAKLALPPVDLILSATAPLSPQLAALAEAALGAPLIEIYGCTEAGQIATRRTTEGEVWQTYDGIRVDGEDDRCVASGGHVAEPTPLADALERLAPDRFRLLGRANDLINVAGKRSSLSHLNFHLNSIEGVRDGAFWLPPATTVEGVARPVAFVVAPGVTRAQLLAHLRERVDPVLLPRRIVMLDALPRDPSGKLPAQRLAALAAQWLQRDGHDDAH
jgi:acyl-coenzyme A synthetase/AMP-(fatty) acid ligase